MPRYHLSQLCAVIEDDYILCNDAEHIYVDNITTPYQANEASLVFISPDRLDKQDMLETTRAGVVLCDGSLQKERIAHNNCLIIVPNPKLTFAKIGNHYFVNKKQYGIHASAIIHPEASIAKQVYIGPYSYIGKCSIGENTVIHGNCYLYDNVQLGENVTIHAGCVIGADGCGQIRDNNGNYKPFPHVGGVIIETDVQIGANSCIAKGALCDTVIKRGTVIDSFVQIGHNVVIDENVLILSHTVIGGSSTIKKNTVLAIGTYICDYITIGIGAHIGPGVTIIKDVPDDAKVLGKMPLTLPGNAVER